jgi:hypothetical protein
VALDAWQFRFLAFQRQGEHARRGCHVSSIAG